MRKVTVSILFSLLMVTSSTFADIAIIVHPNNPIDNLTESEVKKIFLGQSRLFPNTKIGMKVIDIENQHQMFSKFYEQFVGYPVHKLQRYRAAYLFSGKGVIPEKAPDFMTIKNKVSTRENAISYIDSALVDSSVQVVYTWSKPEAELR